MTTPAVLYDHVPIKDDDYDDDTIKEDSNPLRRSRCSYPVSSHNECRCRKDFNGNKCHDIVLN
jgi:hypothetical protein